MVKRLRALLPEGVATLTLAGLIGAASSFLFWLIAARRAELNSVGRATVVVLVGSVINAVTSFGLNVGLLRAKSRTELGRVTVVSGVALSVFGSIAMSAIVGWLWPRASLAAAGVTRWALLLELVALSGSLAVSILVDTLAASYGLARLPILRNVGVLIVRLLVVLTYRELTVGSMVAIFALPLLVSVVATLPWFMHRAGLRPGTRHEATEAIRESLAAWPTSLVFSGVSLALPLVVAVTVGPERAAVFYLLWNVALLFNSLIGAATSLGLSHTVIRDPESSVALSAQERVSVFLVAVCMAVGGALATYVFGPRYVDLGLSSVPLIALGLIPYGYLQYYVLDLRRLGRHGKAAFATSVVLFVMLVGLVILQPDSLLVVSFVWCVASGIGMSAARARKGFFRSPV